MNLLCKLKQWIHTNRESAWKLGVLVDGFDDLKHGKIRFISNGAYEGKKWFADPFILSFDENLIFALVEEYDYAINRGRLAKITINRSSWTIEDCSVILDLPTHLSFPVIYRRDDKIFVCPENNCGSTFDLYEFDNNSCSLKKIKQISKERFTDAIIYKQDDLYYLLSTYEPTPNGNVLTIYQSANFDGPYQKCDEIHFEDNIARNAGLIFEYQGKLIRPAQESNYSYGHGLVFQEVSCKNGKFSFNEISRFFSNHPKFKNGIHTYNEFNGLGIVDFKGYRNQFVGSFYNLIHVFLVKLGIKKEVRLK